MTKTAIKKWIEQIGSGIYTNEILKGASDAEATHLVQMTLLDTIEEREAWRHCR